MPSGAQRQQQPPALGTHRPQRFALPGGHAAAGRQQNVALQGLQEGRLTWFLVNQFLYLMDDHGE